MKLSKVAITAPRDVSRFSFEVDIGSLPKMIALARQFKFRGQNDVGQNDRRKLNLDSSSFCPKSFCQLSGLN